ncbi:MAG: hypothetical protein U0841_13030 [Chloroflexia bacterium]
MRDRALALAAGPARCRALGPPLLGVRPGPRAQAAQGRAAARAAAAAQPRPGVSREVLGHPPRLLARPRPAPPAGGALRRRALYRQPTLGPAYAPAATAAAPLSRRSTYYRYAAASTSPPASSLLGRSKMGVANLRRFLARSAATPVPISSSGTTGPSTATPTSSPPPTPSASSLAAHLRPLAQPHRALALAQRGPSANTPTLDLNAGRRLLDQFAAPSPALLRYTGLAS